MLTPERFMFAADDIWRSTQTNFCQTGSIKATITGFNEQGKRQTHIRQPYRQSHQPLNGSITCVGTWLENLPGIRQNFINHETVAAVLVTTAWVVPQSVFNDAFTTDNEPDTYSQRQKVLLQLAFWPFRNIHTGNQADIKKSESFILENHRTIREGDHQNMSQWLCRILENYDHPHLII